MLRLLSTTLFCCLLLAGCTSAPKTTGNLQQPTSLADFSGAWEIDYALTENPQDRLRYLYEIAMAQAEQQRKMQRDRDNIRPVTSNALRDLQGIIRLGTLADAVTQATVLRIEQTEEEIAIKRSGDYSLTCDFLAPVSKLAIGQESCGLDAQGQLVFAARLPEGLTVINRLSLAKGSQAFEDKRLLVSTTLHSSQFSQPFSLNRVYRLFPPGEGQFACEFSLKNSKTCWLGNGQPPDNETAQEASTGQVYDAAN